MRQNILKISVILAALLTNMIVPASAHVRVSPNEALSAGFQTFTVSVPNEKDIATTSLRLSMPAGLKYVSPTVKPGWVIQTEKAENGEVSSITWAEGTVPTGQRDDFSFSAQLPEKTGELQWKAYQTYEDGTIVSWDQAKENEEEGGSNGPFSVTKVVSELASEQALIQAKNDVSAANNKATTSLYVAVAALVFSLLLLGKSIKTN